MVQSCGRGRPPTTLDGRAGGCTALQAVPGPACNGTGWASKLNTIILKMALAICRQFRLKCYLTCEIGRTLLQAATCLSSTYPVAYPKHVQHVRYLNNVGKNYYKSLIKADEGYRTINDVKTERDADIIDSEHDGLRHVGLSGLDTLTDYRNAKTFDQIPGPSGLPYFGMLFHYKDRGTHPPTNYHNSLLELYARYGKIFKKTINGETTLHLFDPDYIEAVYRAADKLPYILPLLKTTQMYRKYRGMSPGLGNTNGEEWHRLRTAVQRTMFVPRTVQAFLPDVNSVADEFIERLDRIKDPQSGYVDNLSNEVAKWNLESSAVTCFEHRLGCLEAERDSLQQRLIDANNTIFDLSLNLQFSVPWYKLFATPTWKKLIAMEDFFFGYGQKLVDSTCEHIRSLAESDRLNEGQYTFLRQLLGHKSLSHKELSIITLSLFADGLSTTTPSMIGQLYCLAANADKQAKLYAEVQNIAPDQNSKITEEIIQKASYLRACIKEGFRLFPVGTDVSRIPQKDIVIGGYQIPAGTAIALNSNLMLRLPEYFHDPQEYIPERWVRGSSAEGVHPYLLLPFGHGTRKCAGMRLAEQEMRVLIIKLLQRYRLEWPADMQPMGQKYVMLHRPDCEAKIAFIPRG